MFLFVTAVLVWGRKQRTSEAQSIGVYFKNELILDISFLCKYIKVCLPKVNKAENSTSKKEQ